MSVEKTIELRHEGAMRFVAVTGSGHEVVFDDRVGDTAAGPTEVLLAALAACTAMDVASIMVKKRQVVDSYRVRARAVRRNAYPQVFTRIDVVHEVEGPDVAEAQVRRCIELSATKYCPISAMLAAGATEIHHRYRLRRTGPGGHETEGEVMVTGPFKRPDIVATR